MRQKTNFIIITRAIYIRIISKELLSIHKKKKKKVERGKDTFYMCILYVINTYNYFV